MLYSRKVPVLCMFYSLRSTYRLQQIENLLSVELQIIVTFQKASIYFDLQINIFSVKSFSGYYSNNQNSLANRKMFIDLWK